MGASHQAGGGGAANELIAQGRYIDPQKFTGLFRSFRRRRGEIAEGIFLIAQNYVRRYAYLPRHWREEAAAEAALLGIRKIEHYARNCAHANAFSYFTKLVQRRVWEQFKIEKRQAACLPRWGKE